MGLGTRLTIRRFARADRDLDEQARTLAERVLSEGYAAGFLRFEAPPLPMTGRSWVRRGVRVVQDAGDGCLRADTDAFSDEWRGQ